MLDAEGSLISDAADIRRYSRLVCRYQLSEKLKTSMPIFLRCFHNNKGEELQNINTLRIENSRGRRVSIPELGEMRGCGSESMLFIVTMASNSREWN